MESGLAAIRAGIADRSHNGFQGAQALLWRFARKWVALGFIAGMSPGIRVAFIATVAVITAFRDGVVFDQRSQSPTLQSTITLIYRRLSFRPLCAVLHRLPESIELIQYNTVIKSAALRRRELL